MEVLTQPVLLLGLAMILAMIVERLLEIAKSIYDYRYAHTERYLKRWERNAEKIRDRLEVRLDQAKSGDGKDFDLVWTMASRLLDLQETQVGGRLAVSADKVRALYIKGRFKVIAVVFGIACAFLIRIDVLTLVKLSLDKALTLDSYPTHWYGMLLSGVAIGLGTGPMHKLITALEKARNMRRKPGEI